MKNRPLLTGFSQGCLKKQKKLGVEAEAASKLSRPLAQDEVGPRPHRQDVLARLLHCCCSTLGRGG